MKCYFIINNNSFDAKFEIIDDLKIYKKASRLKYLK